MNSEKVKEIKKGLECCTNPVYCEKECPYHIYERHLECINELAKDSLTLINELEKENVILQGTKNRLTFADRIKLVDNAVETKLKQFAERLKEKGQKAFINVGGMTASAKTVTLHDIDETLKECLND